MILIVELSEPKIFNLFPNPIFCYKANTFNNEDQSLVDECIAWRESSDGMKKSNSGGWHSEKTLFKRNEPNIKNLCNLFVKATNNALLRFCPSFPFDKYNIHAEGWVNIGSKLSFNYPHNHPDSNFSGIYYVKVPTKRKDSGLLQFLDPRGNVRPYALGVNELHEPFNDNFTIVPEDKMLIIFPSWLKHWVTPNLQEEDRISIACNFVYRKKILRNGQSLSY